MALRSHVHRKDLAEESVTLFPLRGNMWAQGARRPGIENVGIARKPTGHIALIC